MTLYPQPSGMPTSYRQESCDLNHLTHSKGLADNAVVAKVCHSPL